MLLAVCCWRRVADRVFHHALPLIPLSSPLSVSRSHVFPPPSRLPAFPPTQHDSHCSLDDPYVYRCPARPASHATPACLPVCPPACPRCSSRTLARRLTYSFLLDLVRKRQLDHYFYESGEQRDAVSAEQVFHDMYSRLLPRFSQAYIQAKPRDLMSFPPIFAEFKEKARLALVAGTG